MRRRDVGLGIATGLILMLVGSSTQVGVIVFEPALRFWYVGLALAIAAFVVGRRARKSPLATGLGFIAVAWAASVVSWYVLLVVLFIVLGSLGP